MCNPVRPYLDKDKTIFGFSKIVFSVEFCSSSGADNIFGAIYVHFIMEMDMPEKDHWYLDFSD